MRHDDPYPDRETGEDLAGKLTEKSAWRRALNKAQDFVNDPDTKRFAKAGGAMLDVASRLGQAGMSGPLGIAGAVFGTLDVISNHASLPTYKAAAVLGKKRGLKLVPPTGVIALLHQQGVFSDGEVLHTTDELNIIHSEVDDHKVMVVVNQDGSLNYWWGAWASEGFSAAAMSKYLWDHYGDAVTLTVKKEDDTEQLAVTKTEDFSSTNKYIGPISAEEFVAAFKKYRKNGLTRAYLFYGPPGSGKTTLSFHIARVLGGRVMVVTPDILNTDNLPKTEVIDLVSSFSPNVLLFEDVDRVHNDEFLLSMMDNIRSRSPDTMMISTANDLSEIIGALKRPGRLGVDVEFPAPDEEWRAQVIKLYADAAGIKKDLSHLSEKMDHEFFTHDYIRETVSQYAIEGEEKAIAYIERTIKRFEEEEEDDH